MRFRYFSELLKNAAALIGNSSAGVREAPYLGIPSLDLGTRQTRRAIAGSISKASSFDGDAIADFVKTEWGKRYPKDNSFGEGLASERFLDLIRSPDFWKRPMQKYFAEDAAYA